MRWLHGVLRKPFFGRFEVPWMWPPNIDQSTWERVSFVSGNGAQLAGLWGGAESTPIGTLVLAHPMGKAAKGFWLRYGHTDLFRSAGFNVLSFDSNGFGESEGVSFDYPADILSAGLWAQHHQPMLPVGLVGASFGAGWGVCAMERASSPFRVAVLEGLFPTLPEFWKHYPVAHRALRLSQLVWPAFERRMRPERAARSVLGKPPILLIYGDQDDFTPPEHGRRMLQAFSHTTTVEMMVLNGIGHTVAYQEARAAYSDRVIPFLTDALRASATRV